MKVIEKIKEGVVDALFPRFCVECGREGEYICRDCWLFVSEASFICPVCEKSTLDGARHLQCKSKYGMDGLASCWEFEGLMAKVIYAAKYDYAYDTMKSMTKEALRCMAQNRRFDPFLSFLAHAKTVITYVPMTIRKEKQRGFNQAKSIAYALAENMSKTVLPLLEKTKETQSQTQLDRVARIENIRDTLKATVDAHFTSQVVLVDDVWTSGATMKECARVLKKAGAERIWGFTLARTV